MIEIGYQKKNDQESLQKIKSTIEFQKDVIKNKKQKKQIYEEMRQKEEEIKE